MYKTEEMKRAKPLLVFAIIFLLSNGLEAQKRAFKVQVVGKGEPLLFFPGFTCTDEVWKELVDELSKEYECHMFTFAGFGNVPPVEFPWYPKLEEDVKQYIIDNQLENAVGIGHSLGGTLALSLASKTPIFKKLIIIDALTATGALMFPNYNSEDMVYDSPFNNRLLDMGEEDFKAMANQMASGMALNKEKQQKIIHWMLQADRKTYVYGYTDYLRVDLREAVGSIEIPVTIFAATHPYGKEMAKATYEKQYQNLKGYTLEFAEGSAHFIMYDKPDWLLDRLQSSLNLNE